MCTSNHNHFHSYTVYKDTSTLTHAVVWCLTRGSRQIESWMCDEHGLAIQKHPVPFVSDPGWQLSRHFLIAKCTGINSTWRTKALFCWQDASPVWNSQHWYSFACSDNTSTFTNIFALITAHLNDKWKELKRVRCIVNELYKKYVPKATFESLSFTSAH